MTEPRFDRHVVGKRCILNGKLLGIALRSERPELVRGPGDIRSNSDFTVTQNNPFMESF